MNHLFERLLAGMADAGRPFAETAGGESLSYGELIACSGRYANALVDLGLVPGDRVAVKAQKSLPALILYLATLRAGGVFLPLNPAYTVNETGYFLGDAEPRIVIADPGERDALLAIAPRCGIAHVETLDGAGAGSIAEKAAAAPSEFADAARSGDDLAAILYTSGTTGRSKGAMLSHENLASNAQTLAEIWRFTPQDILLHALPIFHTHGLFVGTNVTLCAGASMIFLPGFDVSEVMRTMPRASVMMGVPTYYTRLLARRDFGRRLTANMRLFISGSAPLMAETHRVFAERTGHAILERYGMTETNMNASNPYDGERRAGTVGFPLPGVELRISEPGSGRALPAGEVGIIELKGPNVFKGYWRMAKKTASEFREDGFFITGDMGRIDGDGYLSIVGRQTDLIISGGLNVYPAEVEAAIEEAAGVAECAVVGVPHDDFGEGVLALIVPGPGTVLSENDILDPLAERLAGYKRPKKCFFVGTLPRNAMGKVEKARLREDYKNCFRA